MEWGRNLTNLFSLLPTSTPSLFLFFLFFLSLSPIPISYKHLRYDFKMLLFQFIYKREIQQ